MWWFKTLTCFGNGVGRGACFPTWMSIVDPRLTWMSASQKSVEVPHLTQWQSRCATTDSVSVEAYPGWRNVSRGVPQLVLWSAEAGVTMGRGSSVELRTPQEFHKRFVMLVTRSSVNGTFSSCWDLSTNIWSPHLLFPKHILFCWWDLHILRQWVFQPLMPTRAIQRWSHFMYG